MWVIRNEVLVNNAAFASGKYEISYNEIRSFANVLVKKLSSNNIFFIVGDDELDERKYIQLRDRVILQYGIDEKYIERINEGFNDTIKKLIVEARDEFFLNYTPQGERIKLLLKKKTNHRVSFFMHVLTYIFPTIMILSN